MRTLFVYPEFPKTFWSYEKILELVNRKVLLPPLGLVTVAALLPQEWEMKLVDRNVREVTDEEWDWAELVIISGMIVQKDDMAVQISKAKQRGLPVAVGGPFASSTPDAPELDLADSRSLMKGKSPCRCSWMPWNGGETGGRFSAEGDKPDVTATPVPRFDLLQLEAYDSMSVQFSRGCPFNCEFCDIIVLYGRKPRTKTPEAVGGRTAVSARPGLAALDLSGGRQLHRQQAQRQVAAAPDPKEERGYPFSKSVRPPALDLSGRRQLHRQQAQRQVAAAPDPHLAGRAGLPLQLLH